MDADQLIWLQRRWCEIMENIRRYELYMYLYTIYNKIRSYISIVHNLILLPTSIFFLATIYNSWSGHMKNFQNVPNKKYKIDLHTHTASGARSFTSDPKLSFILYSFEIRNNFRQETSTFNFYPHTKTHTHTDSDTIALVIPDGDAHERTRTKLRNQYQIAIFMQN